MSTAGVDLVVIGGGINGTAIARDAALRGLSVVLVEAEDLASGTSGWSSRLIHGGLRYLEYLEFGLVRESLAERRRLLAGAPHLVRPLSLLIPLAPRGRRPAWMIRAGLHLYDLLARDPSLPRHRTVDAAEIRERLGGGASGAPSRAALYHDAQVTWAERLVIENALDAAAAGAAIRTRTRIAAPWTRDHRLQGIELDTGERIAARWVVNAAGPWVDAVLSGRDEAALLGGTRGAHLVLDAPDPAPTSALYAEAEDGRPVFVIPWAGQLLVGTTDVAHEGDPREVEVTPAERDYLLAVVARFWPSLGTPASIAHAYSGVRPLPAHGSGASSARVTRRHHLHAHGGALAGLYSVVGGKLTTARALAEEVVDRVVADAGVRAGPCLTRERPLPGGVAVDGDASSLPGVDELTGTRLRSIYGARAARIAERLATGGAYAVTVCPHGGGTMAEFTFALEEEWATTVADFVYRRSMLGLGPDFGLAAARRCLAWAAVHLDWPAEACDRQWAQCLRLAELRLARARHHCDADWRAALD